MSTNREKTTGVMGFVVSMLLHGIFFAGCMALDYTHQSDTASDQTEINSLEDQPIPGKVKS